MTIRLLFFASYRDLLGVREQILEFPGTLTVGQMIAELRKRDDVYSRLPQVPVVAVNEEYASAERILGDGDVVAFIPPVAGG